MTDSVKQVMKRYEAAESRARRYREYFREAYQYAMPERDTFYDTGQKSEGQNKNQMVYDSTAVSAVNGFVNTMSRTLTPTFSRWFELQAGPAVPEKAREKLNEALKAVTDTIFSIINSSNFYQSIGEMYYDLACGTGCMLVLEGDETRPINFVSVPISQISLEEGAFGSIGAVFRNLDEFQGNVIEQQWPDAELPENLKQEIKNDPTKKMKIIEGTIYNPDTGEWDYHVILRKGDHRIVTRTYKDNPFIIARWSKVAGEVFGRGQLLQALPDIKMLNKEREFAIRSLAINAFGIYTVTDDSVTNIANMNFKPPAFIKVQRNAGPNGPSIQPMMPAGNSSIAEFDTQRLQMAIKGLMYDERLPPIEGAVRSATEIIARQRFVQSDIGAGFGRVYNEFMAPLVKRIVSILLNKGIIQALPEIPNAMGETRQGTADDIDNFFVSIDVTSPVSKVQGMEDVQNVVDYMQTALAIDPTGAQATMTVTQVEDMLKFIADNMGVPPTLTRDEAEREEEKNRQAQQQQLARQQEVNDDILKSQIAQTGGQPNV